MSIKLGYPVYCTSINSRSGKELRSGAKKGKPSCQDVIHQLGINVHELWKIMGWNTTLGIGCFRISEQFVPRFADHDYKEFLIKHDYKLRDIGALADDSKILMSFHTNDIDFGTRDELVWKKHLALLNYFSEVLDCLGMRRGVIVAHLGSMFLKEPFNETTNLIKNRILALPERVFHYLAFENDTIWGLTKIINLCRRFNIPLVYDIEHHKLHFHMFAQEQYDIPFSSEGIIEAIRFAQNNWLHRTPKVHLSTTIKGTKGAHTKYINMEDYSFLRHRLNCVEGDWNIMIEAKSCSKAVEEIHQILQYLKPDWVRQNSSGMYV